MIRTFAKNLIRIPTATSLNNNLLRWTSSVTRVDSTETRNEVELTAEDDALYKQVQIEVRSHEPAVLKSYEWFACEAAKELGITVADTWVPPKHIIRRSVLKSAFVHKKHFAQYETRTYFRVIQLKYLTGSTADTYLEYIQRNLPEGVAMKVTKHGIERLPEHMKQSGVSES